MTQTRCHRSVDGLGAELSHGYRQLDRDGDCGVNEAEFGAGFTESCTAYPWAAN
ncbi:hypothetical protein ACQP2U_23735 [Nocardia sp. CA-084685]|uniref:hypothetical protein n=1 Tax=Nocardia sp. CA-084685 TaxID=3239970 RepID=UPI003D972B97